MNFAFDHGENCCPIEMGRVLQVLGALGTANFVQFFAKFIYLYNPVNKSLDKYHCHNILFIVRQIDIQFTRCVPIEVLHHGAYLLTT